MPLWSWNDSLKYLEYDKSLLLEFEFWVKDKLEFYQIYVTL
jgi:hypothetical protein